MTALEYISIIASIKIIKCLLKEGDIGSFGIAVRCVMLFVRYFSNFAVLVWYSVLSIQQFRYSWYCGFLVIQFLCGFAVRSTFLCPPPTYTLIVYCRQMVAFLLSQANYCKIILLSFLDKKLCLKTIFI